MLSRYLILVALAIFSSQTCLATGPDEDTGSGIADDEAIQQALDEYNRNKPGGGWFSPEGENHTIHYYYDCVTGERIERPVVGSPEFHDNYCIEGQSPFTPTYAAPEQLEKPDAITQIAAENDRDRYDPPNVPAMMNEEEVDDYMRHCRDFVDTDVDVNLPNAGPRLPCLAWAPIAPLIEAEHGEDIAAIQGWFFETELGSDIQDMQSDAVDYLDEQTGGWFTILTESGIRVCAAFSEFGAMQLEDCGFYDFAWIPNDEI